MRIISGQLKGQRYEMPGKSQKTRPTTDMAREGLFNILQHQIELQDLRVLDLFAGVGGVGYEFLSRGAEQVDFVEKYRGCCRFIQSQLQRFRMEEKAKVHQADVFAFLGQLPQESYGLVFADPPYALNKMQELPALIFSKNILKKGGCLIIEHDERQDFANHANFAQIRKYGQSRFSIFWADDAQ